MCDATTKTSQGRYAALLRRLWAGMTLNAKSHSAPERAWITTRPVSVNGFNGVRLMVDQYCRDLCDTRTIETLTRAQRIEARLRRQAKNTPAHVIKRRAEKHAILSRGRCSNA